jgi:hypothetical protein
MTLAYITIGKIQDTVFNKLAVFLHWWEIQVQFHFKPIRYNIPWFMK